MLITVNQYPFNYMIAASLLAVLIFLIMNNTFITINIGAKHRRRRKALWHPKEILFNNQKIKGVINMAQAKVDQVFFATWPDPVDKYGNPAEVENVRFVSDNEEIASIEQAAEGGALRAKITTKSKTGATSVRIQADPKIGAEQGLIEGILTVEVLPGEATGFGEAVTTTPEDNQDTPE
jgi:hypothetical protein